MQEPFDAYQYASHLRARWKVVAISCVTALALALIVALIQTRRYTAVAKLVIELPAGSDARTPMVISPVYLESLRTYEHLASSDKIFQRALEKFALRKEDPQRPLETWKRRALKVQIVRNTRTLEVEITLPDARKAQAMAQFIAEEAVKANRDLQQQGDQEMLREAEQQSERAHAGLEKAERQWRDLERHQSALTLESQTGALEIRRTRLERELVETELHRPSETSRLEYVRGEIKQLEAAIARTTALLAERTVQLKQAEESYRAARSLNDAAQKQLQESRTTLGFRGERLRLMDPGIVPEKPSSPNVPLYVLASLLFALAWSLLYLTAEYGLRVRRQQRQAIPIDRRAANE